MIVPLIVGLLSFGAQAITVPDTPFCVGDCRTAYEKAYTFDASGWVVDSLSKDSFYDAPTNLTGASPGDVLKWQDFDVAAQDANYSNPGGTSLSRFVYVTEHEDGTLLPATAFLLLPYARRQPSKKIQTIVWAHGTAGSAAVCAPTNHHGLYYEWSAPYAYAQAGYAVVGPDYTGLGVEISMGFKYVAGWSHAGDAMYSLIAARKVLGDLLADEWMAIGQSEGGGTVYRLNERLGLADQACRFSKAGKFLGTVAIAPALRVTEEIDTFISDPDSGSVFAMLASYLIYSIAGLYSDFHPGNYLTEDGLDRMNYVVDNGCSLSGTFAYSGVTKDTFFKNDSWSRDPSVADWRWRYAGENRSSVLGGPMLVIQGLADLAVPPSFTQEDFTRSCTLNNNTGIHLRKYEGLDHDLATGTTQVDYLAWVKDRFDGLALDEGCSTTTTHNVTNRFYPAMRVYDSKSYS